MIFQCWNMTVYWFFLTALHVLLLLPASPRFCLRTVRVFFSLAALSLDTLLCLEAAVLHTCMPCMLLLLV